MLIIVILTLAGDELHLWAFHTDTTPSDRLCDALQQKKNKASAIKTVILAQAHLYTSNSYESGPLQCRIAASHLTLV